LSYKQTDPFLASFLFSLGLITIIGFKLHLFTGKVGYIFDNKANYLIDLLICWIGNLIGAVATGYSLRLTRIDLDYIVNNVVSSKLNDNLLSIFILSIFCGMMIYIAVEMQKKDVSPVVKLISIIMPVMVFILSGFEHCVANMFYFSYADSWSLNTVLYLLVMSVGNGVGSIILYWINRFISNKITK
jgi:formate/nitrite transporter FocA (FNT family)